MVKRLNKVNALNSQWTYFLGCYYGVNMQDKKITVLHESEAMWLLLRLEGRGG